MDRNLDAAAHTVDIQVVALRKESVDRNTTGLYSIRRLEVALRKESVDRNHDDYLKLAKFEGSLSARRAWIEMWWKYARKPLLYRRSPQGERG